MPANTRPSQTHDQCLPRIAIYARHRNSKASSQQISTCENQIPGIRDIGDGRVIMTLVDSGSDAIQCCRNRPGFQSMLAAAESGQFDVLLITDINRLSRDWHECMNALQSLRQLGVRVFSVAEGLDSKGDKFPEAMLLKVVQQIYNQLSKASTASA